jgi:hypothetical protein
VADESHENDLPLERVGREESRSAAPAKRTKEVAGRLVLRTDV